jgi:DNA-binding NarL/FixJ family response regulator
MALAAEGLDVAAIAARCDLSPRSIRKAMNAAIVRLRATANRTHFPHALQELIDRLLGRPA